MLKCNSLSNLKVCHKVAYLLIILMVAACSTTQNRYVPFERISRIDVHLEKTHFIYSDLEDALPKPQKQARLSGADAIIDIKERKSSVGDTQIYHVTATEIIFLE